MKGEKEREKKLKMRFF